MQESKEVARAEGSSLMLYDLASEELFFYVVHGETGDHQALKREIRLKLNQGIAGVAAATRQSVNVADVSQDARFCRSADEVSRFTTRSVLAVPLLDKDLLIGVIEVVNKIDGGAFTETDLHVMQMFSALAATAITNARLIEKNLRAERMAAIGQAVAGLSHHTKNIISGMLGSTELIDLGLRDNNLEVLRRCWPVFKRSTNRIAEFVQDMLAFSKPREPLYQACSIKKLLDEVVQSFTGLITQRDLTVEINADEADPPIRIDPQGMFRCLLNLFMNAGEAVPQGTGKIRAVARVTPDDSLILEVADNGPGVPEENRRLIFEPFFSTKGGQGTGLGLAVAYKIVKEHKGDITVETGPEGGALFRIVLPEAAIAASQNLHPRPSRSIRPRRTSAADKDSEAHQS